MFELYYNKSKCEFKIKKDSKIMYGEKHLKEIEEYGIGYFNSNYYIAKERKPLVEKAQSLRNCWIAEVKTRLTELENMSYPKR